jgi:hypothetical protein
MAHPVKQIRRSEKQIRLLLQRQEEKNLSVVAFCKAHKIHKATFYNWRNKYRSAVKSPHFVPVQFADNLPAAPFAEIMFSATVVVRIFQQVDACWFKALQQP